MGAGRCERKHWGVVGVAWGKQKQRGEGEMGQLGLNGPGKREKDVGWGRKNKMGFGPREIQIRNFDFF